jgi:sialic acid synthase SpsE
MKYTKVTIDMTQIHYASEPYVVDSSLPLRHALNLLRKNGGIPLAVVNQNLQLVGSISNVDILDRIGCTERDLIDILEFPIGLYANTTPYCASILDKPETIAGLLQNGLCRSVPVVDSERIVKRIITGGKSNITIKGVEIGEDFEPFMIAEIGVNHNGSIDEAAELIYHSKDACFNAVKFQHRSQYTYDCSNFHTYDIGTQYLITQINETSLDLDQLRLLVELAKSLELAVIITPFDEVALEDIKALNPDALKVASCDLRSTRLITRCIETNLPLILSTGMSYEREILEASQLLQASFTPHCFLHCNSTYPTPLEDINLSYIDRLAKLTGVPAGLSCHLPYSELVIASVAVGASILECHITKDQKAAGTDHSSSFEVSQLKNLVKSCRTVSRAIGTCVPRTPSQGELANRLSLGKSLSYSKALKKGHCLTVQDFSGTSPASGISLDQESLYVGKIISCDVNAFEHVSPKHFDNSKITDEIKLAADFPILRQSGYKIGIPVRFHDFNNLVNAFHLDFVEFHMSSHDLDLDVIKYVDSKWSKHLELVVHAIEQFPDGFIFDLTSCEQDKIDRCHYEISRLVSCVNLLKPQFKPGRTTVVVNLGGFSKSSFMSDEQAFLRTEIAAKKLADMSMMYPDYEFMPQTMPPYPWHQGGRSYHNVLTKGSSIEKFMDMSNTRICLDISHTALSCAEYQEDLHQLIRTISTRIGHVHISDAAYPGGEGLEIGHGKLDFRKIHQALVPSIGSKGIRIVPEIWQGHLDGGHKFMTSLQRYETFVLEGS